jgi:phospholipid-binding lipoprotein MlaA
MTMQPPSARLALIAIAVAMLAACATVKTPTKGDPLEGINRTIFSFNDKLDHYALRPVAQGYVKVVPQPVRNGVANFFSNVGDIYTAANDFLQLKITAGTEDVMRVAINTIFGLGGLFDVATQAKLPKHQADFGLTLGHYGVPPGPYLVLPLLGPSTVRDASGYLVDRFADPTSYIDPAWLRVTLYGVRVISTRAQLLGAGDLLADAALDKYSFIRNAYLQRRQYLVYDGNPPAPKYDENDSDSGPTPTTAPAPGGGGVGGLGAGRAPANAGSGNASTAAAPILPSSTSAATPITASDATPPLVPAPLNGPQPVEGASDTVVPATQMIPPSPGGFFPSFRLR